MRETLTKNKQAVERTFYEFLKTGVASGELSPDKDLKSIATMLFTYYNGLNVMIKIQPSRRSMSAGLDTMLSVLD